MHNPLCCANSAAVATSGTGDELEPQPQPSDLWSLTGIRHTPSPSPPPPPPKSHYSPSNRCTNMRSLTLSNPSGGGNVHIGVEMSRSLTTARYGRRSVRLIPTLSVRDRRDSMPTLGIDPGGMGTGNSLCGVLYKWVNYGRGWRGRWFVLTDGVLSFYKLHGPDKIVVRSEEDVGGKLIGQKSFRRMCSRRGSSGSSRPHRSKPSGEIHLEISTIQASKSDEKRFSIFTGTRTIHLRAETREDRESWLQALHEAKDMFPRDSNNDALQIQVDNLTVSTEKLRQRLLEEGVEEAAIADCEQIMRTEFSTIHDRFVVLKQNEFNLIDTLCRLEAEKVDLENTVIKDDQGAVRRGVSKRLEGTSSDPDDINHNDHDTMEEESDDEEDGFFETKEVLSPCSLSSKSDLQGSSFGSDEDEDSETENRTHLSKYEHYTVKRRKKLPEPVEKEKGVSLWSMIKDNIGKDLTKVCLPVYFNEPISSLQKSCEDLEYSYLLDRASENGKSGNYLMRMLNVAAFAVSGYASTDGRTCKPFNPLLGETYEAEYPEKGIRFISEKVSHHPMVIACHCEGRGWKFWGDCNLKNKFRGRSIQLDPVGTLTLEFDDGEIYQWSKVTTSIYNLIIGKLYCDHSGTMNILGNSKYSCKVKFKEQSFIDRTPHQVQGVVHDESGKVVAKLFGKWNESLHYTGEAFSGQDSQGTEARLLWKRSKPPKPENRYNLTRFAITLNELTPGLKEKLPPTDSRLRPDQRHLEKGEYEMAFTEKLRLEEKQRQARKVQEKGWKPKWFAKDNNSNAYQYIGGYWESRMQGNWEQCPDIFGNNNSSHGD